MINPILTFYVLLLGILLASSGCAQKTESHEHDETLTGIWEHHHTYYSDEEGKFVDTYTHVHLKDNGDQVILDHCEKDKQIVFDRENNLLINGDSKKLEINHDDKISSLNFPEVGQLVKTDASHDFHNAGSLTLVTDSFETITEENQVCAQRIKYTNDDTIIIHITIPFLTTYLDMTFKLSDIDMTPLNVDSATFYSPSLFPTHNAVTLTALTGNINFLELSDSHAKFNFDITTKQFSRFEGERFSGSAEVSF